jgi:hypothetical protein
MKLLKLIYKNFFLGRNPFALGLVLTWLCVLEWTAIRGAWQLNGWLFWFNIFVATLILWLVLPATFYVIDYYRKK